MDYKIKYSREIGETPAAIIRGKKIIYVNPDYYNKLSDFEKRFVLLHEQGHNELNTDNEILADGYAFDHLAGTEFRSLNQMLETLEHILKIYQVPEHEIRYKALFNRAEQWLKSHPLGVSKSEREYTSMFLNAMTRLQLVSSENLNNAINKNAQAGTTNSISTIIIVLILVLIIK